ncbi:MAG TPA: NADPH-dependent FMN reductase [Dehalococcoidia bacterium]|jgi:chromate reductase|nr:NADPH-dependent FMN reductase [Dehalococcoidia bacterium]
MKVLTISGSLRQNSWNRKLLRLASVVLKRQGAEVEEFDLTPLPIYNGDVEAKGLPDTAISLRNAIKNADAVVIASPEYNGSMSSAIKNAVEWASRPPENVLSDKVFFIMGTGPGRSGARGMYAHLSFAIQTEGGWVVPSPKVLLPAVAQIISPEGELLDDSVGGLLEQAMSALLETIQRFSTVKQRV